MVRPFLLQFVPAAADGEISLGMTGLYTFMVALYQVPVSNIWIIVLLFMVVFVMLNSLVSRDQSNIKRDRAIMKDGRCTQTRLYYEDI